MIVIGVDAHKRTHTLVAVDAGTGEVRGQHMVVSSDVGSLEALRFVQALDQQRVWAIEDCRHVSGRLERALIAGGRAGNVNLVLDLAPGRGRSRAAAEAGEGDSGPSRRDPW